MYMALRQMGARAEAPVDFAQFFPEVNVMDIANVQRRNETLLRYLFQQSRGRLNLGLDLEGGVAMTYTVAQQGEAENGERDG